MEPAPASSQRLVRVFVSSTFRDMYSERDELVKFTFPGLRRRCRERAVEFVEVDLRWGITDEQKSEGKILPICLAEIDRCRPYFIGLLGERYGWVPEEIDADLARQQEWLREHKEKSVTELEIVHGVLRNPAMRGLAFFYLRDPESSRRVEEELARQPDYRPEPASSREKLNSLKEKIRKSGYAVREGFADPKTLGSRILEDLWEVIDQRFPQDTVPTHLERERMDHEAFAAARTKVYIGRQEYFRRLDEHAAGEDPPLVLLGESGSGKSTLLANWINHYREAHPDDFLVAHYIGSSADSTDHVRLLRTVMEEIRVRYPEPTGELEQGEADIPLAPKKVVEAFPLWVAKAVARGRFILILDALNQLEDRDNAPDLGWLPTYFPPGFRVILSTLPGRSLEALKRRKWQSYSVLPLDAAERGKLIVDYLFHFGRKLSGDHAGRIAAAPQSSNPLYLRALLDELRVYGDHHTLSQRIDHYLAADTADALYDRILARYEEDYERDRLGLVRDAMSLLWASRRGLTEREILSLLGGGSEPLPHAFWSPLFLAMEESLSSKSGMINFFHEFLRNAVEKRYLFDDDLRKAAHLRLASYFEFTPLPANVWRDESGNFNVDFLPEADLTERVLDELPWQLARCEKWENLIDLLTLMPVFSEACSQKREFELMEYWQDIQRAFDHSDEALIDIPALYLREFRLLPEKEKMIIAGLLGQFLMDMGFNEASADCFSVEKDIFDRDGYPEFIRAANMNDQAQLLAERGELDSALKMYVDAERLLDVQRKNPDCDRVLASLLMNQASVLRRLGRFDGVEEKLRRSLSLMKETTGVGSPEVATVLQSLGNFYYARGLFAESLAIHRQGYDLRLRSLGPGHRDVALSLANMAFAMVGMGHIDGAKKNLQQALIIFRKTLGPRHMYTLQVEDALRRVLNP
jgi:nephrocystin-3